MKTKVDKFGRVVIPKAARREAGLSPGQELTVEAADGQLKLTRIEPQGRLVQKPNGMLVWDGGQLPEDFDVVEFINQQREERTQEIIRRSFGK